MSDGVRLGDIDSKATDRDLYAHYGDPVAEQRLIERAVAVVDRSNRGVVSITGPERLTWLHDVTTQHLRGLNAGEGTQLLVLSPHGHVEHDAFVTDDGTTTWLDVEPGTAPALVDFLVKMKFLTRADPADVTADWALFSLVGPQAAEALAASGVNVPAEPVFQPVPGPKFAAKSLLASPTAVYGTVSLPGGGWARRHEDRIDLLVPRATGLPEAFAAIGRAGIWAYEAHRVALKRPRLGFESDHRTLPAEIGMLGPAVHLEKGCYRGQETVARVHNLGKPPRRLALVHLDGIVTDNPPAPGAPVTSDGREVGFVGTAVRHHELGMIALAVLKRSVPDDALLTIGVSTAAIDPDDD